MQRTLTILFILFSVWLMAATPETKSETAPAYKWKKSERKKFMSTCMTEFEKYLDRPTSVKICSCSLEKVEALFPDYETADEMQNLELLTGIFQECADQYK